MYAFSAGAPESASKSTPWREDKSDRFATDVANVRLSSCFAASSPCSRPACFDFAQHEDFCEILKCSDGATCLFLILSLSKDGRATADQRLDIITGLDPVIHDFV
ncbi:MAG: hypothetical protein OXR84_07750 [Magnetovibrio sp.]|nr:hypothetical protein [Magnetovibrio sp.]